MGVRDDRKFCLAEGHVKLRTAADLVRWSLSGVSAEVIPRDEVSEVEAKLRRWADACFYAAREKAP